MTGRFRQRFPRPPLIGVVHLPPSIGCLGCPGLEQAWELVAADIGALATAGVDAVLFENENDKPHTIEVSTAQVAWLTRLMGRARGVCCLPLGVGVQRLDWRAALAVAAACELDFIRMDTWVDRVEMDGVLASADPDAVLAERARLGVEQVLILADVHVKHARLVDDRSIAESAARCAETGVDAVLVTGARTGEAPVVTDLRAVAHVRDRVAVVVGSGLAETVIPAVSGLVDGSLCGTALHVAGRVDLKRASSMVTAWHSQFA